MKSERNDTASNDIYNANRPKFKLTFLLPRYWKIWGLILLAILISLLPYKAIRWIGNKLGQYFASSNMRVIRMRREIARINIDMAFASRSQEERDKIFNEYCINVGHGILDVAIAWFWPRSRFKRMIKLPAKDFSDYYEKKHFLFLCGHFLNIESTARAIGLIQPSYGVYLKNSNQVWNWLQYYMRLRNNKALVSNNNFRQMIATLSLKQGLFYAPDQDLGRKSSIFVPFFDQEKTCTTKGTHMLYKLFPDLTLVPCMLIPSEDPQYAFEFKILDDVDFPADASDIEVVTKTNQTLEKMVELNISNYMWFHRRFKNREDFSNVYAHITQK